MRKLIENPVYMTYEEMKAEFDGKWILVTKCNITPHQELLGGIPVAVADTIFEGHRDGFYDKFDTSEYAPRTYRDFSYDGLPCLLAFFDVEGADGDEDVS